MIALATVLSIFAVYKLPNGGSVTFASMAPIVVIALMYDFGWAMLTAFAYSMVQMLLGFYPPPTQDFLSFALVILLDYVIAFSVLGLAGVIAHRFKNRVAGAAAATCAVILLRLCCHFLSGILIWAPYAPEDMPVWLYSIGYNSSYMIPEMIVSAIAVSLVVRFVNLDKLAARAPSHAQ